MAGVRLVGFVLVWGNTLSTITRRNRTVRKSRWLLLVVVAALVVLVAGAVFVVKKVLPDPTLPEVEASAASIEEAEVGGNPAVILTPHEPTKGIVLYAHGNNQTERAVLSGPNVAPLTAELLDAGYIVAASLAEGNAWGNPASLEAYEALVTEVREDSAVDDLYLLGESMGGLPSLQLASSLPGVKAWAGFYPVCDVQTIMNQDDLRGGVEAAYPNGGGVDSVGPVSMPDVPLMFWASADDTRVPKSSNTDACAATANEATVITTEGNHGDPSNFRPEVLLRFFAEAA